MGTAESNPSHDEVLPGIGNFSESRPPTTALSRWRRLSARRHQPGAGGVQPEDGGFFCQVSGHRRDHRGGSFGNGRDITLPTSAGSLTYGCGELGDSNGQARLSSTMIFGDTIRW